MTSLFYPSIQSLRLSDSTIASADSCPRKLEFKKFFSAYSYEEAFDPEVGTALHKGFQKYLTTGDKEQSIFEMMLAYPFSNVKTPTSGLQVKSIEACYATMYEFFTHKIYTLNDVAKINFKGQTLHAIEVPFQINFSNFFLDEEKQVKVFYVGFIDYILYDPLHDEWTVVDIKTHRTNANDLTAKYQFDPQCLPYGLILQKILGRPIKNYKVIYLSTYVDLEFPKIVPYEFRITEQDVQDWIEDMYFRLVEYKTWYQTGRFPRRGKNCFGFNRSCKHASYCNSRDHGYIRDLLALNKLTKPEKEIEPWFEIDLEFN